MPVDLPSEWHEHPEKERERAVRREYRYEPARGTAFSVSVVGRERSGMYEFRLTVID